MLGMIGKVEAIKEAPHPTSVTDRTEGVLRNTHLLQSFFTKHVNSSCTVVPAVTKGPSMGVEERSGTCIPSV